MKHASPETGPLSAEAIAALGSRSRGISLGIFAGDAGNYRGNVDAAATWGCNVLHFDVMDGVFVPQISGGPGFVKSLASGMVLDAHLMVHQPADHVESFVAAGADIITIHAESERPADALNAIRQSARDTDRTVLAGLAILPDTSIDELGGLIDLNPDLILVAALDPRTKEPADVSRACDRVLDIRKRFGSDCPLIEFDGGVTLETIEDIASAAPDLVVTGSAVLRADQPEAAFKKMAQAFPT